MVIWRTTAAASENKITKKMFMLHVSTNTSSVFRITVCIEQVIGQGEFNTPLQTKNLC